MKWYDKFMWFAIGAACGSVYVTILHITTR